MINSHSKIFLIGLIFFLSSPRSDAAEMNIQLTTNDGSTKMSIQNSGAAEVSSIDSQGNASFNRVTQTGSGGSFIVNQNTLQPGSTFNVSSGTVTNLNAITLKFADGTTMTTAAGGTTPGVAPGSTNYIQVSGILQPGSTFYVSSGTVTGTLSAGLFSGSGAGLINIPTAQLSGGIANSSLDSSSITKQGNTFNGTSQLIQLNASGSLPALNAANLTALTASNLSGNIPLGNLGNAIQLSNSLQSAATFYVSSGTVANLNATTLKFADGTTMTTASGGTTTGVAAGSTNYIQNSSTLQSGATFYISSGTMNSLTIGTSIVLPNASVPLGALMNGTLQSSIVASSIAANSVYPAALSTAIYGNITGAGTQTQALNMNSNLINNVANPVSAADAANKQYVDTFSKGSTNYIQVSGVLQPGATFYVSSGTVTNFNTTALKFNDGTTQTTAASAGTGILNTSTLQSGTTFYVSSGTVSGQFTSRHYAGSSPVPTIVLSAGAGGSPTASMAGSDTAGEITVNAGPAPVASSTIATITFNTGYASAPYVIFSPSNDQSALLSAANGIHVTSTPTTFSLVSGVTAITASVTYKWHYHVIQ